MNQVEHLASGLDIGRDESPRITTLSGGLTNQNYKLDYSFGSFVMRLHGKSQGPLGIDRESESLANQKMSELKVAPPVVLEDRKNAFSVVEFIHGETLDQDQAKSPEKMQKIVMQLKKAHAITDFPHSFCPFGTIESYHQIAQKNHFKAPAKLGQALECLAKIKLEVEQSGPKVLCHNDLLCANFIDDGSTLWIIDWEYCGLGNLYFDLGNFCANQNCGLSQKEYLLELYFGQCRPSDLAKLNLMDAVSDMREAFWGFLQDTLKTPGLDYRDYANQHFERFLSKTNGKL